MQTENHLTPQAGSWVKSLASEQRGIVVKKVNEELPVKLQVKWLDSGQVKWYQSKELRCGFPLGIEVQDIPASRTRTPLGEGIVREVRNIGGRDQVLVEFLENGRLHWLPYENLRAIKGVRHRFQLGQTGGEGNAERFRLRCLAHAIEMWHENTGSLSRLDIDPLPHQIHLVHHILASGNFNWLVADDVGLGKTIETGMLMSALTRRGSFRRILLVTPAGLVNQWKEELHHKFGMSDFVVYGEDFHINEPRHWKLYDHVIGSIDRLKSENHLPNLMQADNWDLIVFDEGHRLSRIQTGMRLRSSERFRLAASMRKKTDSLILLTGTPHQGKKDKFQALLELIRPEHTDQIRTLSRNPDILRQMVIRNHKSDVTDADGNFIFQGKTTASIQVDISNDEKRFDESLQRYLRQGYTAGDLIGGKVGRAIGFVMFIYRKLAASSIAAIERALIRRLAKLTLKGNGLMGNPEAIEVDDERFAGEWEEQVESSAREFFEGEVAMLEELILMTKSLKEKDSKFSLFVDTILSGVLANNVSEKIVVFTEYRTTQAYIAAALEEQFGPESVALIHGSMPHQERTKSIAQFEDNAQFLISTEAGGEGINLHRECHVMINYDMPWNPMRLVQRVGRLYRYGQKNKVIVFNIHCPQTLDGKILDILYYRISQVVDDMSVLGGEFRPGLEAEILGEIAETIDIQKVMDDATRSGIKRTSESIDEALERARTAVAKQRELLDYAAGYDPEETKGDLRISLEHVQSFIDSMIDLLGIAVLDTTHKGKVKRIQLPESLAEELILKGHQLRITLDRELAANRPDIEMMDLDSPLLNLMLERAKSYAFDGRVAKIIGPDDTASIITAMLRWQNDQGTRMRQEYTAASLKSDGTVEKNSPDFIDWLLQPAKEGTEAIPLENSSALVVAAQREFDSRLKEVSNVDLHPENMQLASGAWCSQGDSNG